MKPYANQGIVTRKVGDYWITWNANLHSIGELNPQNSAAGETYWKSYNRYLDKFLFGRKDNPIFRRRNPTDEPLTFRRDHGVSERYLDDKRRQAEREGYHTTSKGTKVPRWFGSTTAWLNRDALFPVKLLDGVPGMEGEETFDRIESLEYLIPYMTRHNTLPKWRDNDGIERNESPFINAWIDGKWYTNEGNHRIKVARRLGWKYIPLQIRWYSGADIQPHRRGFTPEQVVAFDEQAHREGYTVNDFRGIL